MRTLNETVCTGECKVGCPVALLGGAVIEAANDVVDTARRDPMVDANHDDFDEHVAGMATDILAARGLSEEHAPAVAGAAQLVMTNECLPVEPVS